MAVLRRDQVETGKHCSEQGEISMEADLPIEQ